MYEDGLQRRNANYAPLTPVDFLVRASEVYGDKVAILYGQVKRTWRETFERCVRLSSALVQMGIQRGDTVAAMLPNIPEMVEAHFGVPMAGAVLNALNTRLDADAILYMLDHGEARALIIDTEYAAVAQAVAAARPDLTIIKVQDTFAVADGNVLAQATSYDSLIAKGDSNFQYLLPLDEWDAIALNYTSGTTGKPKGVVYSHRGAHLTATSNVLEWDMAKHPVYLWTLPMFHCNGWCFPWTIAARAGTNVCLRRVDAKVVFDLIREHCVTHYSGAPIVHSALADAPDEWRTGITHRVKATVAGAAPSSTVLARMEAIGFELTHVYGLTEVYGPAAVCAVQDSWAALSQRERAEMNARQGVRFHLQAGTTVVDPQTMQEVPRDGETIGEVVFRGNLTMKGYLKNRRATDEAFSGGWFHTGDLGVLTADGYVKLKDRSKDIIISGGENISSIEIEDAIYRHAAVSVVAVVAQPDPKWGEVPCAFVELRPGMACTADEIVAHCRSLLASFKIPKAVRFGELPKTATGKIQKFALRKQLDLARAIDHG
ncbi:acyl-CoA synthetase [Pandoraea sp.]|uniref:acyl-CoA synthetase n=1 Tax=Pandoraea sp. TaxID=1883445 RepID=UPI0011F58C26|nr:acyl-CoA synthetase [Pandoraea sp.]TAL52919.1 MAG: acyl-CoA synthetase [Pandoraea sp.]TAM19760.1 MAG: acyl-CoA synthetase [Pandoraea sp.]